MSNIIKYTVIIVIIMLYLIPGLKYQWYPIFCTAASLPSWNINCFCVCRTSMYCHQSCYWEAQQIRICVAFRFTVPYRLWLKLLYQTKTFYIYVRLKLVFKKIQLAKRRWLTIEMETDSYIVQVPPYTHTITHTFLNRSQSNIFLFYFILFSRSKK